MKGRDNRTNSEKGVKDYRRMTFKLNVWISDLKEETKREGLGRVRMENRRDIADSGWYNNFSGEWGRESFFWVRVIREEGDMEYEELGKVIEKGGW